MIHEIERRRLDQIAKQEDRNLWARRNAYLEVAREELRRKQDYERERQRLAKQAMIVKYAAEEKERQNKIKEKEDQGRIL